MNQTANLGSVLTAVEDAGLFVSLCTIKVPPATADALGQLDQALADYTVLSGHVDIPCMSAPLTIMRPSTGDEIKAAQFTADMDTFHVLLDGYYPLIKQRYIAVIDGIPLDIMGAESDSQSIMTRMACRRYSL